MRGRGRGSRGRGRVSTRVGLGGRSGRVTKRPALPFRLQKELAAGDKTFTGTREFGRDQAFRKSKQNAQRTAQLGSNPAAVLKGKQANSDRAALKNRAADAPRAAQKRKRGAAEGPELRAPAAHKTNFQELLGPSAASEEQLQQQIAAKLGLKPGKQLAQEDDNMAELLTGADRVLAKPGSAPAQSASGGSSDGLLLSESSSDGSLLRESDDSAASDELHSNDSEASSPDEQGSGKDEADMSSSLSRDADDMMQEGPLKLPSQEAGKYKPPAVRAAEAAAAASSKPSSSLEMDERVARRESSFGVANF
ncbi:hypothetical protein WJX84_002615 [Apatococcus fuscideae]|uniref:Uncharacterized protein n=1 Tax=Apatococcus fuscideae TaxID=2026836 RepID=A0AAW1SRR0_9CHLO